MSGQTQALIEMRQLSVHFYSKGLCIRAVDGLDLTVIEGTVVGIVGESGCGKSTTALAVMRLLPAGGRAVRGSIKFMDKSLLDLSDDEMRIVRGRHISQVFQDPLAYINPTMTIGAQIAEKVRAHLNLSKSAIKMLVISVLSEVGLAAGSEDLYAHEMSGGMRQRALIAMAIACEPELIIADEPTSALDVTTQAQILDLFKGLRETHRTSFLFITHDLGIAAELCDWIYVMYAGTIMESGSVYDIFERPEHPYTQALIGSALSIDEFRRTLTVLDGYPPDLASPPPGCRFHPRCVHAESICRSECPSLIEVTPGHNVACWLKGR